jgi:hypothetical protein
MRRASTHPRSPSADAAAGAGPELVCVAVLCVFSSALLSSLICSVALQVHRVDDLRVAVELERVALEQLQGMISSERKLLGEGSRCSASPLPYPTAHIHEVQHQLLWESERQRVMEATMRSSAAPWPAGLDVTGASRPGPLHGTRQGWEDEKRRRAAEKRAAFLTSAAGMPADCTAASHSGGIRCVGTRERDSLETKPCVSHKLFTAGGGMPPIVTGQGTVSETRQRRAEQKRAAFLSAMDGNQALAHGGSEFRLGQVLAAMTDDAELFPEPILPSMLLISADTGDGLRGHALAPSISRAPTRSSLPQSPFVAGTREYLSLSLSLSLSLF